MSSYSNYGDEPVVEKYGGDKDHGTNYFVRIRHFCSTIGYQLRTTNYSELNAFSFILCYISLAIVIVTYLFVEHPMV